MKTRLIMKRLRDVVPGDIYVGRSNWQHMGSPKMIVGVRESTKKPGKLTLLYLLEGMAREVGGIRRWPDFYVIVVKQ